MNFPDLSTEVRALMVAEIDLDIAKGVLYRSPRLAAAGWVRYPSLLRAAASSGSPESLAGALRPMLAKTTTRNGRPMGMPNNAAESLAEGEFNRFYERALCRHAIATGRTYVRVYRAKAVRSPRPESEAKIGQLINAAALLEDLRTNIGNDTDSGIPGGVNSGLSVRL